MEFLENLNPAIIAVALGALVFLFLLNKRLGRKGEPDWVARVRENYALGNYEQAGLIQLRHGNRIEALNLFEQGGIHRRAWPLASKLGQMERAANHAESAGEYDHAAGFYQQAGNLEEAIRILNIAGRFSKAAALMEQKGGVAPYELGRAWEKAYHALLPDAGGDPGLYTIDALKEAASKAAQAFKRAGRRRYTDHFVELAAKLGVEDPLAEQDSEPVASEMGLAPSKGLSKPSPPPVAQSTPPQPSTEPVAEPVVQPRPPSPPSEPAPKPPTKPIVEGELEIPSLQPEQPENSILDLDDAVTGTQSAVSSNPKPAVSLPREAPTGPLPSDEVCSDESMRALESIVSLTPAADGSGDDGDVVDDETAAALEELLGNAPSAPAPHSEPAAKTAGGKTNPPPAPQEMDQPVARIEIVHIQGEKLPQQPHTTSDVVQVHDQTTNMATAVRIESDRYLIGEKLGEGGMAVVFKALDRNLEREVALKFLPQDVAGNPRAQKLFKKEAKSVARLNHPNIVTIFDFGVLDGRPFICMELINGGSLNDILKPNRARGLPLPEALDAAEGLLSALDYAHGKKIVHRDIKPHNIMRTPLGTIKLMDFGIAKVLDTKKTTIVAGTPAYMAPEQMMGKGIDRRTDIFAVGVTVYEMLTGFLPFNGMRRERKPAPLSKLRQNIPQGLDALVLACCELKKSDRPGSAGEVLSTIKRLRRKHPILNDDEESTDEPGFATPRLSEIDSDTARNLLDQCVDAEALPEESLWPIYSAALKDKRAAVRKSAIELYPGEITGKMSKSLVALMAEDGDDDIRKAAQERLQRDGSKPELISPLAKTLVQDVLDPMPSEKRQALFKSIVDLTGSDSLKVFEEAFATPSDDAHLDDLISAVSGEEEEVRERIEQAALVWRNKRVRRKVKRPTPTIKPAEPAEWPQVEDDWVVDTAQQTTTVRENDTAADRRQKGTPVGGERGVSPAGILKTAEKVSRKDKCDSLPPVVAEMLTDYLDKS